MLNVVLLAVALMVILNLLMVVLTLGTKLLRLWKARREKARTRELEDALGESLVSGEVHPRLRNLRGQDPDLLAGVTVEYLSVLSGEQRDRLVSLTEEAGLLARYRQMLKARNRWRKARAAENLGHFGGGEDVGPLSDLLSHPDETVRAVAARALARIGTPDAAGKLAETLNDTSELTRLRMAENLERIGPLAAGPLARTLDDGAPEARVLAARVLGNLRAAVARPALARTILGGGGTDLRAQATLALGRIGNPDDVPILLRACEDGEWPVRAQAANALEIIGDVSAIPALQRLAVDRGWWVRLNASRALANMGPRGEKALARVLDGADRYARDRAVSTLEERGVTRRIVGQLAAEGEKGEAARALIRAMVRAGATRYLGGLARGMPDGPERRTLTEILEGATAKDALARAAPDGSTPTTQQPKPETALPVSSADARPTPRAPKEEPPGVGVAPSTGVAGRAVPRVVRRKGGPPKTGAARGGLAVSPARDGGPGEGFDRGLGTRVERAMALHRKLEADARRTGELLARSRAELEAMRAQLEKSPRVGGTTEGRPRT